MECVFDRLVNIILYKIISALFHNEHSKNILNEKEKNVNKY